MSTSSIAQPSTSKEAAPRTTRSQVYYTIDNMYTPAKRKSATDKETDNPPPPAKTTRQRYAAKAPVTKRKI